MLRFEWVFKEKYLISLNKLFKNSLCSEITIVNCSLFKNLKIVGFL